MSRETMLDALELAYSMHVGLLDITGGEPALWPHLEEFVSRARQQGHAVRVRTNLTALAEPARAGVPTMLARAGASILASLPGASAEAVSAQRGASSFERSIAVLQRLAELGYGTGDGLALDIAYNPPLGEVAAPVPTDEFRAALAARGVAFDELRVIANVPIGRYRERLHAAQLLDSYLDGLAEAFNPDIAGAIECRNSLTVGWDGTLSDCDFNLGAGMRLHEPVRTLHGLVEALRSDDLVLERLATRRIAFGPHCFACTAGAGSG